jgi:hypothetical protein
MASTGNNRQGQGNNNTLPFSVVVRIKAQGVRHVRFLTEINKYSGGKYEIVTPFLFLFGFRFLSISRILVLTGLGC